MGETPEEKMFESPLEVTEQAERGTKWKIVLITAGVCVVILAAIVYLSARRTSPPPPPGEPATILADADRPGSPPFEEYKRFVSVENQDGTQAENLLGQKMVVLRGLLVNRGSRTLTGAEVKGILYDFNNKPVANRLAAPIPRRRPTLGPDESMMIEVTIDPVPPGADISMFEIVIQGLKFQ